MYGMRMARVNITVPDDLHARAREHGLNVSLVAQAALPSTALAFDIGTGTGVLASVLARRGVQRVVATDIDPRALACARDNIRRLGLQAQVEVLAADLFPTGKSPLLVCNPPYIPRPDSMGGNAYEGIGLLAHFIERGREHLTAQGRLVSVVVR